MEARLMELSQRLDEMGDGESGSEARVMDLIQLLTGPHSREAQEGQAAEDPGPSAEPEGEEYDDERNQRWLAGRGLIQLRDFVAAHGVDEGNWPDGLDAGPVTEYARRVLQLQRRATRNFILDYVLQQGTSSEVRGLIDRHLEDASRFLEG